MSMYPNEETVFIDGKSVSYPGLKNGKFTSGDFNDPLVPPSYIPAETINLILDNLGSLVTKLGKAPNNSELGQLAALFTNMATATAGMMRDAGGRAKVAAPAEADDIATLGSAHFMGELIFLPYLVSSPSPAEPLIDRSVFRDIDATNAPDLVARLKNELASVRGTTSFPAEVSGSTVTFTDTSPTGPSAAMLRRLAAWGLRMGFLNQNMNAYFTADFSTAATRKTIRINSVDYGISGVNISTRTITVVGAPPNGQHSASFATYAVPGNHNKIRLPSLAGAAIMGAGDYDGEIDSGWGGMDMMQWHWHTLNAVGPSWTSGGTRNLSVSTPDSGHVPVSTATNLITDGINGSPRPGKQTRPAFGGAWAHTFAGRWIP